MAVHGMVLQNITYCMNAQMSLKHHRRPHLDLVAEIIYIYNDIIYLSYFSIVWIDIKASNLNGSIQPFVVFDKMSSNKEESQKPWAAHNNDL